MSLAPLLFRNLLLPHHTTTTEPHITPTSGGSDPLSHKPHHLSLKLALSPHIRHRRSLLSQARFSMPSSDLSLTSPCLLISASNQVSGVRCLGCIVEYMNCTIKFPTKSLKNTADMEEKLKKAKCIVLTYSCDDPATFERLSIFWLPKLVELKLQKVPVVVVGCKLDARKKQHKFWEYFDGTSKWLMKFFYRSGINAEIVVQSSARNNRVSHVFTYALRAIMYPVAPLFDVERRTLTFRLVRALKRVFYISDEDKDKVLDEFEFASIQYRYSVVPFCSSSVPDIKAAVLSYLPEGVCRKGVCNLKGFLFLHGDFLQKGCYETTWKTVRAFGYRAELVQDQLCQAPDQRVELADYAKTFLKEIFISLNPDQGVLPGDDVDALFSSELESHSHVQYRDAVEVTESGGLTVHGFLCMWELMAIQEPAKTVASLIDIGYLDVPASALRVTRARRFDRDVQQNERDVFQCYVFGPKKAGKSAFLNYFLGRTRTVSGSYTSTSTERFAVNVVDLYGGSKKTQGSKKTLVLREIPEKKVKNVLSNENCFAACDIAIFVYDSSDKRSWERTKELFAQVAGYSEKNSCGVPCYFLYAKEDPHDSSSSVGPYMNITLGRVDDIFLKIVNAAECPQQNIPGINGNTKSNVYHGIVEPLSDCSVLSLLLSKMDENQKARTCSRKWRWAYR